MKKISLIIVTLLCAMFLSRISAQTVNEITLTVTSDGPTKDDAIKNALRGAIEQAYGAFVSANTTILNDDLVKDEIVTVSNGSIKEYKELACVPSQNGSQFVTVQATVSLPHLIKYSQSKGSECEFAGNTFGMSMKLFELQKQNELKALRNLTTQIEALFPATTRRVISVGEPSIPDLRMWNGCAVRSNSYAYQTDYASNESANDDTENLKDSDLFLRLDPSRKSKHYYPRPIGVVNEEAKSLYYSTIDNLSDYYEVPIEISWYLSNTKTRKELIREAQTQNKSFKELREANEKAQAENGDNLQTTLKSVLESLSLSEEEANAMKRKGIQTTEMDFDGLCYIRFRNEPDSIYAWAADFNSKFIDEYCNFVIVDNTGQRSSFSARDLFSRWYDRVYENERINSPNGKPRYPNEISDKTDVMVSSAGSYGILGEGLYHNPFKFSGFGGRLLIDPPSYNDRNKIITMMFSYPDDWHWSTKVLIPKSEIEKYSNFRIEPAK